MAPRADARAGRRRHRLLRAHRGRGRTRDEPIFTTKDLGKGTGLGLDISRRVVVERHHGSLDIDAGPKGTTMRVTLPVRES